MQNITSPIMKDLPKTDFCITIDFDKKSENPTRIFQAMTDLINAFQSFDKDLIKGIDTHLEPVLLLENVESGSIKTWLSSILKGVPDEALKSGDVKKILGHYLVKCKYILINKLDGVTEITDANFINDIRFELYEEAKKTDIKSFPYYEPIPIPKLIDNIDKINKSFTSLSPNDKVFFEGCDNDKPVTFNMALNFTPDSIEDMLTKETLSDNSTMILKVKKPDYLGSSMWDFKYNGRTVQAKILDDEWLLKFQKRKVDIRPGDSVRAKVRTIVKYGHDNNVLGTIYEITNVEEVLPLNDIDSLSWLDQDS